MHSEPRALRTLLELMTPKDFSTSYDLQVFLETFLMYFTFSATWLPAAAAETQLIIDRLLLEAGKNELKPTKVLRN